MIISEKKRIMFNKQGSIQKMDILHSIRRKQIISSELDDKSIQNKLEYFENSDTSQYLIKIAVKIVIMIVLAILVWNFIVQTEFVASSATHIQVQQLLNHFKTIAKNKKISINTFLQNYHAQINEVLRSKFLQKVALELYCFYQVSQNMMCQLISQQ